MAGERRLPGLGLYGFWTQGTAWKAGADENWLRLSALVQGAVLSRTTALPTSPADGAVYIVPTGATNAGKVAVRDNGAWTYLDPRAGIRMFVADSGTFVFHDGSVWKEEDASAVFSFLSLTDAPKAFGAPGQLVAVDAEGDALIFVDPPSGGGGGGATFPPFTNNAGKVLAVNAAGDGVEWVDQAAGGGGDPLAEGKLTYPLNYAAYRYYRITSKNTTGTSSYQGLGDFDLREKSGQEGPTPIVLSVSNNGAPMAANTLANWFDSNPSSAYELSPNPVFTFVLDYGSPKTFVELNMVSPWANEVPNDILIEGSNDNAAFIELEHQQFAGLNTSPVTRTLTPKVGGTGYIGLTRTVAGKAGQALVISGDGMSIETVSATDFLKPGGTAGKHRYGRTLFTYANPAGGRNDYVSIAELEWRQEVGGAPTGDATNAFASGSYSTNNPPGLTQDRNAATFWESQSGSQTAGTIWLGMDFLEPVPLAEIKLQKSTNYPDENPFGVSVQWSDDKIAWTTAHTFETGFLHTAAGSSIVVQMPGFVAVVPPVTSRTVKSVVFMTEAEYAALPQPEEGVLYLTPVA